MDENQSNPTPQERAAYWREVEERLRLLGSDMLATVARKNREYNESWRKRGGIGAFMMLARKWDRIEEQVKVYNYDILRMLREHPTKVDGPVDDLQDLIGYLWLVLEFNQRGLDAIGPCPAYVDQAGEGHGIGNA